MPSRLSRAAVRATATLLLCSVAPVLFAAQSDEEIATEMRKLPWQSGPATGNVSQRATLKIPDGASLLPEANGSKFLELSGNLPEPGETILVHGDWWATLSFDESGYVKDDEKLDADALLKSLQESQASANTERRKRGMPELINDGWIVPPHYDPTTRYLEYGLKLHASDNPTPVVNYTMRLLSRRGYETVMLVTRADTLNNDVRELHGILGGFDFNAGEKYSEFRDGDHVAEFGLGALVLGGAAAAAVKAGWFKGLLVALAAGWKFVVAAGLAGIASLRKLFGRAK